MLTKCLFLALLTQCLALQEQDCTQVDRKTKNLTIQLQVSQSSEFDFSGYIPAVELALHFINRNSCVLPDYHISFTDVVDPQVSRKHFHYISICIQYLPCTWSNKDEQHCGHTEKKVTYLGVVRLLLLCWKAFLENTTPHQQDPRYYTTMAGLGQQRLGVTKQPPFGDWEAAVTPERR